MIAKISDRAKKARGFFSKARADEYERQARRRGLWQPEQELIERILRELPPGSRVLDAPVGTGRFLRVCAERGLEVTGIDASPHMVRKAKARGPKADIRVGDIFNLDAPDQAFDLVLSIRFLHLIDEADAPLAWRELSRVARDRVIVTAYIPDQHEPRGSHERLHVLERSLGPWEIASRTRIHGDWYLIDIRR